MTTAWSTETAAKTGLAITTGWRPGIECYFKLEHLRTHETRKVHKRTTSCGEIHSRCSWGPATSPLHREFHEGFSCIHQATCQPTRSHTIRTTSNVCVPHNIHERSINHMGQEYGCAGTRSAIGVYFCHSDRVIFLPVHRMLLQNIDCPGRQVNSDHIQPTIVFQQREHGVSYTAP